MKFNTRIAPSPTGSFHIGTARTAYFNWLAARATGGTFLLRIDDTDSSRSDPAFTQQILDSLDWLGLDFDAQVYQSRRDDVYSTALDRLLTSGRAKVDNQGVARLTVDLAPPSWRDDVAGDVTISQDDRSSIVGLPLARSDGSFLYHFTSVVDDVDTKINLIIRGVDHLSNTSRQVAIWCALDAPVPRFAHVGLIRKDKKKLSKRDGAASLLSYRDAGYDADAMLNFLLRLGWGPTKDDKTTRVLWRDDALRLFLNGGGLRSADSNMDLRKLDSFDRKFKGRKRAAT